MESVPACNTYQIKVSLHGAKPPIWRRLLVPSSIRLATLHHVLQVAMGWENDHLHQFKHGGHFYGVSDGVDFPPIIDEEEVRFDTLLRAPKEWLIYEYDFGDSWEHVVLLEKVLPADPEVTRLQCTGGRRAGPPEDVGGVWGYSDMLEALENPDDPENAERLEWLGEFDPTLFDREAVNRQLASIRVEAEDEVEPSHSVPRSVVDDVWERFNRMDAKEADSLLKRWHRKQPNLLDFVIGFLQEIELDARELGVFLALMAMESFRAGPARKLKKVCVAAIERCVQTNMAELGEIEQDAPDEDDEELDGLSPPFPTAEPVLMACIGEVVADEGPFEEDGSELQALAGLFLTLKTVVDCLHAASRF